MTDAINKLWADIADMEAIVLYYQNRVLRKRIAVEELIQSLAAAQIVTREQVIGLAECCSTPPSPPRFPGVTRIVREIIAEEPGLSYSEIKARCLKRYPAERKRIGTQIWATCQQLIKHGAQIEMDTAGTRRKNGAALPRPPRGTLLVINGDP